MDQDITQWGHLVIEAAIKVIRPAPEEPGRRKKDAQVVQLKISILLLLPSWLSSSWCSHIPPRQMPSLTRKWTGKSTLFLHSTLVHQSVVTLQNSPAAISFTAHHPQQLWSQTTASFSIMSRVVMGIREGNGWKNLEALKWQVLKALVSMI